MVFDVSCSTFYLCVLLPADAGSSAYKSDSLVNMLSAPSKTVYSVHYVTAVLLQLKPSATQLFRCRT